MLATLKYLTTTMTGVGGIVSVTGGWAAALFTAPNFHSGVSKAGCSTSAVKSAKVGKGSPGISQHWKVLDKVFVF